MPKMQASVLDRREVLKRGSALGIGAASLAALGGPAAMAARGQSEEGVRGGSLSVAVIGEPPTLDIHQSGATIVAFIMWNVYETLFTFDSEFGVIPMLAESHDVSEDGLTQTIHLRQGVPFHNGEEMKSADVIASIQRWSGLTGLGGSLMEATDEIVAVDDYTIEFKMNQPYGAFVQSMALNIQGLAIYPQSVLDAAGDGQVTEFIGTGPYKFAERQADRFIRLERFEEYAALDGEADGYGGHKYQYLDEITFVPVPDEAARIAGLQAGDYHYLESITADQAAGLEGTSGMTVDVVPPNAWSTFVLNWKQPLMGELKIRQAVQAALDHEAIMLAAQGDGFYRLDPGVMFQETVWHTSAGEELYNQNDPEKAKQLMEEAGYDGTPIRWITTQEYANHYNLSMVGKQQLEEVGFTVDLQVYDWATVVDMVKDPEVWDIYTTGINFRSDPVMIAPFQPCEWNGWWCSDAAIELMDTLKRESDFDTRYDAWEQLQQLFYDEVGLIKLGDQLSVNARSSRVQGFVPQIQLSPILWNVWLEEE